MTARTPIVPYLPFARPSIDEESIAGVAEVLRSGWIASGPNVLKFEQALSEYHAGRHARVVTSATAALELALHVAGVGPGAAGVVSGAARVAAGVVPVHSRATVPAGCLNQPGSL